MLPTEREDQHCPQVQSERGRTTCCRKVVGIMEGKEVWKVEQKKVGYFIGSILPSSALLQLGPFLLIQSKLDRGRGAGSGNGQWSTSDRSFTCTFIHPLRAAAEDLRYAQPKGRSKDTHTSTQSAESKPPLSLQPGDVHATPGCHGFSSVMWEKCRTLSVPSFIHEQYV